MLGGIKAGLNKECKVVKDCPNWASREGKRQTHTIVLKLLLANLTLMEGVCWGDY